MSSDLAAIEAQIAELEVKKAELLSAQRSDARARAVSIIMQFRLTAAELGLNTAAGKKGLKARMGKNPTIPMYANPKNSAETWHGGKGPKPGWVREFLGGGGKLEDALIGK